MSARERQRGKVKGRKEEAREQVENREEERTGENERTKRTNWEGVRWLGRGLRPRGRRDEPGGSQRPKITAMTFAFSHSPPRVPLWTRCLFSFRDLFLLSNPPIFSSLVVHLSFSSSLSLSLSLFSPTIFGCYSWRETFWERIKTLIYSAIDHGRAKLYRSINNRKIIPREARLALSFVDSTCNRIIDTVR